jgi:glycosyltransferase involved in cell wall biosynthesis
VKRLAIVSNVVPPSPSGQAIVLAKLVADRPSEGYVLVATKPQGGLVATTPVSVTTELVVEPRSRSRLLNWILLPLRVLVHAERLARAVRRHRADVVVGCTGDLWDLPVAMVAARRAKAEFVAYLFDDYVHQWPSPFMRAVARRLEGPVLRRAETVIATNETLAEAVRQRVGAAPVIVRNPADATAPAGNVAVVPGTIVYTGAVYAAHYDAFRWLLEVLERLDSHVTLNVYTRTTAAELVAAGIRGRLKVYPHRLAAQVPALHAAADVLFLPLASSGVYHPELIRTSAPGKLGEYLAAGRPLLAVVPAGSFVDWYVTTHDCGTVVTEDGAELAKALDRLLHDEGLRTRLARNARARFEADFALTIAREAFQRAVGDR